MRTRKSSRSIKYKGIRIRRRGGRWQVDYGVRKGRRTQRSFITKETAKDDVDEHLAHESPEERDIRENAVTLCHLTQHERVDVLEAIEMLKGIASLREAGGFFIHHHSPPGISPSVEELLGQYKEAKRKTNRREWHLRTIEYRIGKFADVFGPKSVAEITSDDIVRWIDGYLAIALFAGVRPAELQHLTWDHVNFDLRYIHIGGDVSKVRNERYVDMEDVLIMSRSMNAKTGRL